MMIQLSKWSYCPVLDEMLRHYYYFQIENPPIGLDVNKRCAQRYVENTKSNFDDIIKNVGRYFTSGDFEFDSHIGTESIHRFVTNFERFVRDVVREVKYILGIQDIQKMIIKNDN